MSLFPVRGLTRGNTLDVLDEEDLQKNMEVYLLMWHVHCSMSMLSIYIGLNRLPRKVKGIISPSILIIETSNAPKKAFRYRTRHLDKGLSVIL